MLARDERLLDAAIEVLGTRGMRHLTHRAVDAAAGLPEGSTSNRFRTRETLMIGVLRRILERERILWTRLAAGVATADIEGVAALLGRLLDVLTTDARTLTQARCTVFVEAANQPALASEIAKAQQEVISWLGPLLAGLGSADPSSDVQNLLAFMDGLVGHQLASPQPDFDPAVAIAALLRGLVDRRPGSSGGNGID